MLISFSVENFRSIKEKVSLSLVPSKAIKDHRSHKYDTQSADTPELLRSVVIYGTNGSGKTNLLRALDLMRSIILESAKKYSEGDKLPIEPFLLDESYSNRPTFFSIEFLVQSIRYQYSFSANKDQITAEMLYAFPKGTRQIWFERIHNSLSQDYSWKFGSHFKGDKSDTKEKTLKNTLYFSKSVMDNNEQLKPLNEYFREKILVSSSRIQEKFTYDLVATPEGKEQVKDFLKSADLGIDDFIVETREISNEEFPEEIRKHINKKTITYYETTSVHKMPGTNDFVNFSFSENESTGTNKLFFLSGLIINTLSKGGALLVDELEISLHCQLLSFIIDIFNSETLNKNGAQLIFTTHAPTVLENNNLRRDQIWFTDKTPSKNTILYSLVDIPKVFQGAKPVRKGQDLTKAYLEGRFYTPPKINRQLSLFDDAQKTH